MKHIYSIFCLTLILTTMGTVIGTPAPHQHSIMADQEPIKVVTTLNFLGDFAQALLGEDAEITSLIDANQDPHFYEPGTQDLTAMSEADLILGLGSPEFDEWLSDYVTDSGDKELQQKIEYAVEAEDLEDFDPLTGVRNPHFWLDPEKAQRTVESMAQIFVNRGLISQEVLDPNYISYQIMLETLISEIDEAKTTFSGTKVVVDHPSFYYLLKRLEIERVGALEEKEGEEPSPQHLQELIETMRDQQVELIVASIIQAGDDVEELARNTGAKIAYLTPLPGIDNAENYTSMIRYNLGALENPENPDPSSGFLKIFDQYFLVLLFFALPRILRVVKKPRSF